MRHSEIGNDNIERFTTSTSRAKSRQTGLAAISDLHLVTITFQNVFEQFAQHRLIIDAENLQRCWRSYLFGGSLSIGPPFANGKYQAHGSSVPWLAFDLNLAFVPLNHAINHRQTQASATPAFGGEKWLQTMLEGLLIHADPSIADF